MNVLIVGAFFFFLSFFLSFSWHFVLVLVVMFVLGIIFFVYSFSGFGFWCFDVEFLLTFLRSYVVLALGFSA